MVLLLPFRKIENRASHTWLITMGLWGSWLSNSLVDATYECLKTSPQLRSSKYHGEFVPLQSSGTGGSLLGLEGSFPTVMIVWKSYDLWAGDESFKVERGGWVI